jgi:chemotaxis protein methyltransferase CheR
MMTTTDDCQDDAELDQLLEGIFRTYHHDFRHYVRASVRRRIATGLSALRVPTLAQLSARVLADPRVFAQLLRYMTIQVSDLFRDPSYWRALREHVIPHLATYPFLRVWIAGCGAGEEAYSMAILLAEAGLLERSQLYATDVAVAGLVEAASGSYGLERARTFSDNYFKAGGKASLSDYYVTTTAQASFVPELRRRILFSDHSLATDTAFAEMQLISCRNVFIYFDRNLQDRALGVLDDALCPLGFLGLGQKETLLFSAHAAKFESVVAEEKIYRKRGKLDDEGG